MREHCCRENELTFPVGALRVAVSYRDRRNYQSRRGASVRKVQYTRKKDIPEVQVKAVPILIGKDVGHAH